MHSNWDCISNKHNSEGVIEIKIQQWYTEEASRLLHGLGKPLPNNLTDQLVVTPLYYLSSPKEIFSKLETHAEMFAVTEAIILLTESVLINDILLHNDAMKVPIQPLLPKGILPIFASFFKDTCNISPRYNLDLTTLIDLTEAGAPYKLLARVEEYTILYDTLSNINTRQLKEQHRFIIKRAEFICNKIMNLIYSLKFIIQSERLKHEA